jgi:cell division protein FtsZ
VIATGFQSEKSHYQPKKDEKKVHDLDRSQGWLFNSTGDNSVNEKKDLELRSRIEREEQKEQDKDKDKEGDRSQPRELVFTGPFNKIEETSSKDDDGDDGLFQDDDYDNNAVKYGDQVINDEGMMELRSTKQRLQKQAEERKEKIKQSRKSDSMTKEEFSEKWSLPAYLRRGVKMNDVPHSSEPFISKYNLNDDNNILGNNKFLHDNVD